MSRLYWTDYTPPDATSARGWLMALCDKPSRHKRYTHETMPVHDDVPGGWREQSTLGNYLDYGPDHYRAPHEWCGKSNPGLRETAPDGCQCELTQPGRIHCVCYASNRARYVETVEQARDWIAREALRARPDLREPGADTDLSWLPEGGAGIDRRAAKKGAAR